MTEQFKEFSKLIIYQIYPRSFMDSNGDGIGDLVGICEKLPYLKELGINAIWLCPCYKSPNADNGYDISDYRDIMTEFGTMDDIKTLIASAHKIGIKVIMDLVPNHTSSEHKWFIESKKSKDNPYSDYYYWFDTPPNDWQSVFRGSAYEYCEERNQYYLHSYTIGQPDLNWDNPKVVKEIQDIIDFWVDLGVDGFRCDVIDQISKDFEHGENCFGPNLHKYIKMLFGRENTKHLFTVGECWATTLDEVCKHCSPDRKELTTLFQFDHIECGRAEKFEPKKDSLKSVRDILIKWQNIADENGLLYSLFTDNHDQPRFISRIGNTEKYRYESATCIATMFYTLRGIPFIYQGQEFGTSVPHYDSLSDFDDIETFNYYKENAEKYGEKATIERINFGSRDNNRRPMCWSSDKNGGFTSGKPWIPLHSDYKNINLENDKKSDKSVFEFYKKLLNIRSNSDIILYGSLNVLSGKNDDYFAFEREYNGEKMLIICNFEKENKIKINTSGKLILSNYNDKNTKEKLFSPYEIAVYKI